MLIIQSPALLMIFSLTLLMDHCACQITATIPVELATIPQVSQGGPGVGRKLPQDKHDKLCHLQSFPNLCKDNMIGVIDWEGECEKIADQLHFKVAVCFEITPDITYHKDEKYNVCALNNEPREIPDPSYYYVTSKALTSHAVENSTSNTCKNGLNELIVKKKF